jgi:ABC-type sugar transport system ATPase subunit
LAELRFAGVRKDYGPIRALRGLDLDVADGELLVLVGPSASGKSTALRVAAGLEETTEGTIHIGDRDVTRIAPAQRNVSMVFQNFALFPHLTVGENIGFGLRARGVAREEARTRSAVAAGQVGCGDLLERKPFELSGGERQRVALARALVREPDVFLLDEPLSNLDAQLRVLMRAELKQLHDRVGATMVYVTHDQIEALTLGDRVAVLHGGVLQQIGTPTVVYRQPANRFVASFIGSPAMNIFSARVEGGVIHAGPFEFAQSSANGALEGREAQAGIRPEHVRVALSGPGSPVDVELIEIAGNETFLHLDAGGSRFVARVGGEELVPDVGSTVRVGAEPRHLYLFDAGTGETINRP